MVSDITGKSATEMLEQLDKRTTDPQQPAGLARGKLKSKRPGLEQALHGLMGPHQRMLLNTQLQHLKFLDLQIEKLTEEVEGRMRPFEEALSRLDGVDMTRVPSAAHLAFWTGLCNR